jgi:hypothetical protein
VHPADATAPAPSSSATLTVDQVDWQGQRSLRVRSAVATWLYHLEGGGFAALLDRDGKDWISYRPSGGCDGRYRGFPNAVFRGDEFVDPHSKPNYFHPGHEGAKGSRTTVREQSAHRVVIASESPDGRWACSWEIQADHARFTFERMPTEIRPGDPGWWFLYEGTPGGAFRREDFLLRADETTPRRLAEAWATTLASCRWVACWPEAGTRSLLFVWTSPLPAYSVPVTYWPAEDAMTVLGFGRDMLSTPCLLATAPASIEVHLLETCDPAALRAVAAPRLAPKH